MKKKAISKLAEVYKHLSSFAVHDKRNTRQPKENKHEGKCISPFLFHSLAPCIYYIYCPLLQNKGSLNNGHDMDKSNRLQETQQGNNTNGMCRWSVAEKKKKKAKHSLGQFQFLLYFFIHSENTKAACAFTLRHKNKVEHLAQMFSVKLSSLVELSKEKNSMDQSVLSK